MVEVNFAKIEPADKENTIRNGNSDIELPKIVFPKGDEVDANAKDAVSEQWE